MFNPNFKNLQKLKNIQNEKFEKDALSKEIEQIQNKLIEYMGASGTREFYSSKIKPELKEDLEEIIQKKNFEKLHIAITFIEKQIIIEDQKLKLINDIKKSYYHDDNYRKYFESYKY